MFHRDNSVPEHCVVFDYHDVVDVSSNNNGQRFLCILSTEATAWADTEATAWADTEATVVE